MSEVLARVDKLSPERRDLLQKILRQQALQAHEPGAIRPRGGGGPAPLSFAQQRLWMIDQLQPGSVAYNMPAALRVGGALDTAALERALGEIVRRHEALRTTIAERDGEPVQVITPFAGFALPVDDLSDETDREAAVRRRAGEEASRAFDLSAGPLFRAALLRLGEDDHVLLISMHHIVSDGWSMGVFYRELSALYETYREGRESPLPDLPVQYADYAVWQREQLEGEVLDRQLSYWRAQLSGAPELLELPADRSRPPVQTFRGATIPVELSLALLEQLEALGRNEGATLYMVLLGAFQVLLSKYTGSDDIVVGSPIAGRTRKEVEELIGFFVNTLVLRTDLSGDPGFREVLRRAREVMLGASAHQEVPFEKLVAELQPERSLGHSPLFQVMFTVQNAGGGEAALPGLEVREVEAERATAKFDFSLVLTPASNGLRGSVTYSTDLFERGTVEQMLDHLERVLEQVATNADVRLSQLDLVGDAERARLLALGEGAVPGFPRATVDALFAQTAAAAPEAVALAWDGGRMTYAELDERANRLAHHLRRAGVAGGTRVGVCLERGPEMVVAMLAALKAGGAYVPLDPAYPAERLAFMLADTAVPVLVTESPQAARLPAHGARVIRLDDDAAAIAAESCAAVHPGTDPESAAYVMYTSGSTGRPKGVEVPHRAIVRLVRGQDYVSIDPADVFLQLAPASFDAATLELWGPLLNGARLAIHPAGQPSVESIGRALAEHGVTILWLTAGLFHLVVEERIQILRGVRQLLAGGDVLSVPHVRRVLAELPETALINGYGPTENTTFTCCHRVGEVPQEGASIPVGRPIANTYVRVLDAGMRPVPVGVPGELYAGGAGLALGYLDQPERTAETFVADPHLPGARLYRTGDRVRWMADGTVEFLGRVDTQVKIRGFRVEPGEVEAVLRQAHGVADCAVLVREDAAGDRRLVAYVAGEAAADEVREHLRGRLPEHMLPAAFVLLDALPLTPNGKLDRRALPAPELASAEEAYVAPRTPVEEVLAGIWAEVLRLERVGVEDGFFALGGHSLLATRVVSRVREVFGVELPLRALFEGPTLAELAVRVEELRRAGLPVLPPVEPVDRGRPLPLSFAQERLWFLDRMDPGNPTYNVYLPLRLRGALDAAALGRALGEIVRRHEALRTTFRDVGGPVVQVIAPAGGFVLPVEDVRGRGEAERDAVLRTRAAEEAVRPFDLAAGPLFRATLLRLDDDDHALLLAMHHVVSDGWSTGVLFREMSALYEAYREGRESPLAGLPVQYADYAVWQRAQLAGEVLDRQLAYWKERLSGAPELLDLPTDHPRPPVQTHRGATIPVDLSLDLLERLQALGRSEGATLYMTLLCVFQRLLSKYSGSEDIVVGSPIAGRTRGEVEGLIGFFVNTLVLRTDLSGDPSFRETLRRVREATLGAYAHQEVPFEKLVAELQPERSLGHSPLFQVMFTLQDAGGGEGTLPGLGVSRVEAEHVSAKFDLSLTLTATARGLRGGLTYSTDLFERGTAERMLGHLERVLAQAAADPDLHLSRLELMGPAERACVAEWNRTEAAYPADRCIHHLFEAQVERTPDAPAVEFEDESLTYRELNERANRLAHFLRRHGVGPEVRVGICLERSPELVVSLLAVLKAGGAYVPLVPGYPAERLERIAADAGIALLLTAESLRAAVPAPAGVRVVSVDAAWPAIAAERRENPESGAGPGTLAYVIYTSGSTGTPKGVAVQHASLVNQVSWFIRAFQVGPRDRVLQKTSIGFDASVWEFHVPLLAGARLVLAAPGGEREPGYLARTVRERGITLLQVVPALLRVLADEPELRDCSALRLLFCGGEALPGELARRAGELLPAARVVNLYGPTECCIQACTHLCAGEDGGAAFVPIGRPVANTRAWVLGPGLQPAAPGIAGELYLGGVQVARGYLDRPGLTAERFVPDPFSTEAGARMYRTGDRARWRADGTLAYLGRLDDQVKVRGFRIEPGEIEAALRQAPGVSDCAVVVREDEPGDPRLAAYIVGEAEAEALRDRLRRSLPEFMLPSAFVFLDALPLTPNGKLDRRALPAPEHASAEEAFVAPRTPVEEVLAGIYAEVLKVGRVGATDNFFELGGHSLLATLVMARLYEVFALRVPLRVLFEGPTVAELAERVEALRRKGEPQLPPVVAVGRDAPLPLTFAQERLWFLQRLQPEATPYNHLQALRLSGALDAAALERSLGEIVRRHEPLRTTFPERSGAPVQVVLPFAGFPLPRVDLSALPDGEREAEVERRAAAQAAQPFDFAAGPIFRGELLRLAEREHVLLLCMHHIVTDGWSTAILYRELSTFYATFRDGRTVSLPEPAVRFGDFAAWQRGQLEGEAMDRQLAYWRQTLAGAPTLLHLPTDRPRPAVQSYRGGSHRFLLPARLAASLERLQQKEGATLYMVLLAAFQTLLGRYAGTEDVVVGSPIAGRTQRAVEELIGFFVNTLVLRTDLGGDPGFRELLRRVRKGTLAAYEHQDAPFERLVEELQPARSLGHNPVFQAFFGLHNMQAEALRLPGLGVESLRTGGGIANFDLSLFVTRREEGLEGVLVYATDLFDAATVERMAGHLEVLLEAVAEHPERRLSELPLVTDAERRMLLETWSGRGEAFPAAGSLHGRFEAQAATRPDAFAVSFEGRSLTYAQLNARANRLARRLRALGVAPESRVALCAERSPELVAGILAILKAGAAYVPLDPANPAERLAYMAEDSGVRVLLAQSALRDRVPVEGIEVVALEDDLAGEPGEDPGVAVDPSNLAYVIYTSGSTGRPKGVGVTHGNVLRLFASTGSGFGFSDKDVWTLFHSCAFDFSVWEIWGALLHGGRLVVVPFDVSRDPVAFRALLAREEVTSLSQTPSAFRALAKVDEDSPGELASLRTVVFGGEALQYESLRGWLDRYGPRRPRLVNLYGITETTVHVTWHAVTGAELKPSAVGSTVGTPIPDLRAYVLDPAGQPQPAGVPGELHVGGAGLARGYLGRPALTAQRFVPDPFSGDEGARLYRSGDLARWRADGTLEYLGRIDQQVKVRGFRIEPGEIESVLLAQAGVAAAAVVVRGEGEDAALVAYVVPSGEAPSVPVLREALRERLPDYMVPAAFVPLERIPLTANGKLDRRALPEPDAAGTTGGDGHVAPRTPTEEVLAGIWTEVLKAGRVGATDNFFELGGHSLLATQVMARVHEVFGVRVPLRTLFESPTVAALAAAVEALCREGAPAVPPVVPVARTGAMPLSFAQERLWFLQRLQPESTTYNHPTALRLTGALDAAALARALGEVVRRHESLRTTFPERDGAPVQVVAPFAGFAPAVADLSHLPAEAREAEVARRVAAEAARVWDLAAGPPFDAALLRLDAQAHVLILSMHHIVTDGWSMGVLFRELSALYEAYRKGEESPLAPPAVQYADYAVWQREQLRGEALERETAFWRERLAGAPALLEVPTDHPRGPLQAHVGAREGLALSAGLRERLRALGRREGATPYMVLLGAFQLLLAKYAATDDVVVGSPIAGRTRRETEGLIGFFVNTLVLRTDLSGDPGFREVLRRVRETTLAAWQHQELPFERLVEELQPERSLSHSPLFQVMFALVMEDEARRNALAGVQSERVAAAGATTKFDLNLAFVEEADGLRAVLEYSRSLFEPATIRRMLAHLARVLEQVAGDAELPLSRIALLDEAERAEVVERCNATGRPYAVAPAHVLFAEQARRTPDAAALLHGGRETTYAALDRRAEAVARRLRELGVGTETLVGLCVDRTPELLASVLGIWKAGAAYVPLDPDYPAERLAWMVADARLPVVVTAARTADALPHGEATVVRVDQLADEDGHPPVESAVAAENLAYVIYTSGSTGRPKGVLVQHGSLANLLAATREAFGVRPGDVMPALASYSFDIWLFETLLPLTSGAAVRLVDRERVLDVPSLLDEAADATLLHAVPALMRQVARVQRESGRPTRLRRLFVGGDRVPADLPAEMADAFPGAETHVLYGPTEGTILASAHPVPAGGRVEGHPIGTPFGNVRLYVCDRVGNPQPAGLPGELWIGGAGVGRGYLGRPALTAERFVPDPFGPPGSRLYRTGDRVRRRADGSLEYLGRLDAQVKVRGFRVEPGEIEAALRRHAGVRECVVVVREDTPGEPRLVAYVAGEAGAEALKEHLRRDLPDYMVPSAWVILEALPTTPNGKLDRRALPAPGQPGAAESAPPRDALEARVAEVWREVLGAERVGIHDNFFDLGGTSLLLYRVYSRLRELRAELRVVDLFRYTTVEELAAHLGADAADDAAELAESRARAQERRGRRRARGRA